MKVGELALAAFLMAGHFKSDPRLAWLPVDLTLALAACVALAVAWRWLLARRVTAARASVLLLVLFGALSLGLLGSGLGPYARDKAARLFTLTLLGALAPGLLLGTEAEVRRFLRWLAVLGGMMALDAVHALVVRADLARLSAFHSDTIALGRATGTAFVWLCVAWLGRRVGAVRGWVALAALGAVLFASGTRAALLASGAAVLATLLAFHVRERRVLGRVALGVGGVVAAVALAAPLLPGESVGRVLSSLQGAVDTSAECRLQAYARTARLIAHEPLGIGTGDFPERVTMDCAGAWLLYPHNLLLEVALENGLPVALLLLALFGLAVGRLVARGRATGHFGAQAAFALLAFYAVNVMFSGDLNDNKLFLALLGLALCSDRWLGVGEARRGEAWGAGRAPGPT